MMAAVCTSETSVDNHFTRQYNPEDSSEHHTRRRENLKSHISELLTASIVRVLTKTVSTFEMLVSFYQMTWLCITEDSHLHTQLLFEFLVSQHMQSAHHQNYLDYSLQ
jgi:hypothetical protein